MLPFLLIFKAPKGILLEDNINFNAAVILQVFRGGMYRMFFELFAVHI